jgi:hypothetical protein
MITKAERRRKTNAEARKAPPQPAPLVNVQRRDRTAPSRASTPLVQQGIGSTHNNKQRRRRKATSRRQGSA